MKLSTFWTVKFLLREFLIGAFCGLFAYLVFKEVSFGEAVQVAGAIWLARFVVYSLTRRTL
jgi:hypothetical protein